MSSSRFIPSVLRHAPEAVLLVVTNPVDIMTHLAAHFAAEFGVPHTRIIGSGTTLDTARFRALLGRHFDVDPQHVHAYVLGEHGGFRSAGLVAGHHCRPGPGRVCQRARETADAANRTADSTKTCGAPAYQIIAGKGATYYGIGSAVARIVDVLLHDQRAILTICARIAGVADCEGVTLALPHLVGGRGALATIPLSLDETERDGLRCSAGILREALAVLKTK
jgi:L-lactate dehydrogenase